MNRFPSALLAASVAGAALAIPAASAYAAESTCSYTGEVGWNVRDSFNSYLLGNIANGSAYKHKGGLDVRDGVQTDGNGKTPALTWPVDSVTSSKISTSGGAHWTGHNLYTGDDLAEVPNNFTLDLDFSNITVELNGSSGRLLVDYTSREYINTHTLGPPHVLTHEENGKTMEPMERVVIDVPEQYQGNVMTALGARKGILMNMQMMNSRSRLEFRMPSRGLFGYRSQFLTDTHGEGIMNTIFDG